MSGIGARPIWSVKALGSMMPQSEAIPGAAMGFAPRASG
jgi:hypothetical protein